MQGFKLDPTLFGYNSSDRVKLHEQLFEIVWAGNGKWSLDTIYNMPLPMRRFWVNKINEKFAQINQTSQSSAKTTKMPVTKQR